ncbi:hypothetical protein LINGRAHAP2_LOCUS15660 [Linum grandiflorum]
MLSVRGVVIGH